jgi:ketosteroid isomerase-like protein
MTRSSAVAAVLSLVVAGTLGAQSPEADVRKAQEARFAATIKPDLAGLSALLADDMTYAHANSKLETKAEFLDLIKTGHYQYKSITPRDVTTRLYGDTALLGGLADVDVVSGGQPLSVKLRFLEVWVKQGGRWKLAAWQATRLPAPTP